jgi:hypothetical protein
VLRAEGIQRSGHLIRRGVLLELVAFEVLLEPVVRGDWGTRLLGLPADRTLPVIDRPRHED